MLVLDSMRAYISDISKERIQATDSILAAIPGGLTKLLQPLDISVNKSFKAELRKLWESWMCHGKKSFTNMRCASYQTVVQWVKDAWNTIPDRIIISGFIKAKILDMPEQPTEDEEMPLDDEHDLSLALATLFHSDIEDSDFDGFMSD